MTPLQSAILQEMGLAPITAASFEHLASRRAVAGALSELLAQQEVFLIARGTHIKAVAGRFGKRPPVAWDVLQARASARGERLFRSSAHEAHALGFTNQMPVREIHWTDGPSRTWRFQKQWVQVKRMPDWRLQEGDLGAWIRALDWSRTASKEATDRVLRACPVDRQQVLRTVPGLPAWARRLLQAPDSIV
jgi:hypothetical protein